MKPNAVLLTVILLMIVSLLIAGSFNTKDEKKIVVPDYSIVYEVPLNKEAEELPPPPPDSIFEIAPMMVDPEPIICEIVAPPVHTIGCDLIPRPVIAEEEVKNDSDDIIVCNLPMEVEAEYPGGAAAWQRYLNRNMRFPEEAIDEMQFNVVVQFVVDEEGYVSEVETVSGSKALGEEAARVIKQSSKWKPALRNGRRVKSSKRQPFIFHPESE